jgi:hypothetical protein
MTNWNVVTGDDGREYLEVEAIFYPSPLWEKSTDQSGSALVAMSQTPGAQVGTFGRIPVVVDNGVPPGAPYTLEDIFAMRNQVWDRANPSLDASKITTGTFGDALIRDDGVEVRRDSGPIDGPGWRELTTVTTWPEPQLPPLPPPPGVRMWDKNWNQIQPGRSEPEHPAGRFQNLDWDEAS